MAIIQQLCLKLVEEKKIIFSKIKWNTPVLLVSRMVTLKPLFEFDPLWFELHILVWNISHCLKKSLTHLVERFMPKMLVSMIARSCFEIQNYVYNFGDVILSRGEECNTPNFFLSNFTIWIISQVNFMSFNTVVNYFCRGLFNIKSMWWHISDLWWWARWGLNL